MTQPKTVRKLHVNVQLQDGEIEQFLRFKEKHYLRNSSEAGRKLILERLEQEGFGSEQASNGSSKRQKG